MRARSRPRSPICCAPRRNRSAGRWPSSTRAARGGQAIRVDGALLDSFRLARGYWEAKDSAHDLDAEISRKLAAGYPQDNILFQSPARVVVIQQGQRMWDAPASEPDALVAGLHAFFTYQPPAPEALLPADPVLVPAGLT